MAKHNALAELSARLIIAAHLAGVAWALENPADRGDSSSDAFWRRHMDHAPIFITAVMRSAAERTSASFRTFCQCSFGSKPQKWTTIMHAQCLDGVLSALDQHICRHGYEAHEEQAHGLRPDGSSRSADSASYPPELNEFLAEALARWARSSAHTCSPCEPSAGGGLVADGPQLGESVREACDSARLAPARFASRRNLRPSPASQLRREAYPGDLHLPPSSSKPPSARRPPPPRPPPDIDAARRRIDAGPIPISELFLDSVYETEVLTWLALADEAALEIVAGRTPKAVPSRIISQSQLQPWARGIVWDCQDPFNCVPVVASTRYSIFRGKRQLDRAAIRRVAAALAWHDQDIVGQAGEGGIEVRSQCSLDIVLAFHHLGLRDPANYAHAAKVVEADWSEEWADRPVRHLPFVPCRVLPRNVVFQERSRLVPSTSGGPPSIELYPKPRITTDSSHGAANSVNAGVPDEERYVQLPTVQQHARGVAITDTAGGGVDHAFSYVVDAESAYRFCPVQEADLWTQVFFWWDASGAAGFCIDRRLSFGGAFAPNRFERVSTLVAAHIQSKQAAFDASQPPPQHTRLWSAERRSLQREGLLPAGEHQLAPRSIVVYIDDFLGSALDDRVDPSVIDWAAPIGSDDVSMCPAAMAGASILLSDQQVVSEGGTPADPSSRVHVHARLAVQGLRDVGLSAAPHKVVVGDPVIALGIRVSREARCLDCPLLKRASMIFDIARQRADATATPPSASRARVETLVGRVCNLSQVFPEVKSALHGGYALSESSWLVRGRRVQPDAITLQSGSTTHTEWIELLDLSHHLIDANLGVDIAPELTFPSRDEPGMITITTDASGNDGVGGYAFAADEPGVVYFASESWEADTLAALANGAAEHGAKDLFAPSLSVSAVELFGATAFAVAVAAAHSSTVSLVTAVGDSDAACGVLNTAASGNPQMHILHGIGAELLWLGVSVPRELNVDADRLSHPRMYHQVEADAVAAGLVVRRVHFSGALTDPATGALTELGRAAAVGVATRRPKRHR